MLRMGDKSSIVTALWKDCGAASEKLSGVIPSQRHGRFSGWFSTIPPQRNSSLNRGVGIVIPAFYTPYSYYSLNILKEKIESRTTP